MTPVAKTGLHCGDSTYSRGMDRVEVVTPVAKTGLHCGAMAIEDSQRIVWE